MPNLYLRTDVNAPASYNNLLPEVLEQKLYQHLLDCVREESPVQVLERFRQLFIVHGAYPEQGIRMTLDALMRGGSAKQSFLPFFNRCCFILINRWQPNLAHRGAVTELVEMLQQVRGPSVIVGQPTPSGRLRFMVQEYVRSAFFTRLCQLSDFLNPKNNARDEQKPLGTLLHRYPYLYTHCMIAQEDESDYQKMIGSEQKSAQTKFERDLSDYLSHSLLTPSKHSQEEYKNPTLLSPQDVTSTLKTYLTKGSSRESYRDLAQQFWSPTYSPKSYATFKSSLYDYLIDSVPPKFGRCRFNGQLSKYIRELYPENNAAPVNDFLVVRSCNQILNFLVIESRQRPSHSVFMDLLNNLGSTLTIGLMLKVVLLCGKVRPYLDRRFSLLFQHYESQSCSSVRWLVKCFEKLNLAWCAHFGRHNLSYVNLL